MSKSPARGILVGCALLLVACSESHPGGDAGGAEAGVDAGARMDAGTDAGATCAPCGDARACCGGACVNLFNDPRNCGSCGTACGAGTYCTGGACVTPPCSATGCAADATCCGGECCGPGQLCCDPQGPIDASPRCMDPVDGTCPQGCAPLCMCASPDTPIATPRGDTPIAALRVGDLVYSVERWGIVAVPIARVSRTPVVAHRVVRVVLANGSTLEISGLHPTADGRAFRDLAAGETLDGVRIESVDVIPYPHPYTHDILPASSSGHYFAGGVLIGSTLTHRPPGPVACAGPAVGRL